MLIKMQLKDVIKDDRLIRKAGLNPYCCNEGADPEDFIEIEVKDVVIEQENS